MASVNPKACVLLRKRWLKDPRGLDSRGVLVRLQTFGGLVWVPKLGHRFSTPRSAQTAPHRGVFAEVARDRAWRPWGWRDAGPAGRARVLPAWARPLLLLSALETTLRLASQHKTGQKTKWKSLIIFYKLNQLWGLNEQPSQPKGRGGTSLFGGSTPQHEAPPVRSVRIAAVLRFRRLQE